MLAAVLNRRRAHGGVVPPGTPGRYHGARYFGARYYNARYYR